METILRYRKTLIALLAIVALLGAWWLATSLRGQLTARFDVARGHYKVLTYGLPSALRPEYARLLKERYGIELETVAGCIVSQSLLSYVHCYNKISVAAANRKFGHDVFEECWEDANKNWNRRRPEKATRE